MAINPWIEAFFIVESNSKIDTGDVIAYVGKKWEKRNTPKSADAEKIFKDGAVRQYRIDDSGYIRQFTRGNRNIGSTRPEDKSDSGFLSERGRSDSENKSLYTGYLGEDYEKYENTGILIQTNPLSQRKRQ